MQFWTSSEAMADIDTALNSARSVVERTLKTAVGCENYGSGVSKWALIYIVMNEDDPAFQEVSRYTKRMGVVEFRLKVDYHCFKSADSRRQRMLLAATVLRSIELSGELQIADFDSVRFRTDVVQALKKKEWV
jgi:hypothetical protein